MRLTEHELTLAVTGAAKSVLSSRRLRKRGQGVDEAWESMSRYERFKLLDAVGSQILPVLTALPDVETAPGERVTVPRRRIEETVDELVGQEQGKLRRAVVVKARTALVQVALAHVPPRSAESIPSDEQP